MCDGASVSLFSRGKLCSRLRALVQGLHFSFRSVGTGAKGVPRGIPLLRYRIREKKRHNVSRCQKHCAVCRRFLLKRVLPLAALNSGGPLWDTGPRPYPVKYIVWCSVPLCKLNKCLAVLEPKGACAIFTKMI